MNDLAVIFIILALIALILTVVFGFVLFTSKNEKRKLMKKTKIAALISAVLVPIMTCSAFYIYSLDTEVCVDLITVPDLKGLEYEACSENGGEYTLIVESYEYSSEYPEGTIIHQNLPAGRRQSDYGYEIKCVVSKGKAPEETD